MNPKRKFVRRPCACLWLSGLAVVLLVMSAGSLLANSYEGQFADGAAAYRAGDFARARDDFKASVSARPSSGALQGLGLAEWQMGHAGEAILAWERARWLDPFNKAAQENLHFVRQVAQIESPSLTWYEVVSSWLPVNWWAWISGISLWLALSMTTLPHVFRWRKAGWHQALAAFSVTILLLSLPAHLGIATRSKLGFIVQKDVSLRLTPTANAQQITRLGPGDPARWERRRGNFVLIRTARSRGWVEIGQFASTCPIAAAL